MTWRLLRWTLEKPPVPLSGILYEQGQSQQDQDLQCGAKVKGTSGLAAHRLTNLIASRNQSALQVSQTPFCTYCTSLWRAGISIPYTESLSCGETLWRVGLSIPYTLSHWAVERPGGESDSDSAFLTLSHGVVEEICVWLNQQSL